MTQQHTPGPWTLETTSGYSCGRVVNSPGYVVIGREYIVFHLPTDGRTLASAPDLAATAYADARLIAASPLMYDYIAARAAAGDSEACRIMEAINA